MIQRVACQAVHARHSLTLYGKHPMTKSDGSGEAPHLQSATICAGAESRLVNGWASRRRWLTPGQAGSC